MKKSGSSKYIHFLVTLLIFFVFWNLHIRYSDIQIDERYNVFVYTIYAFLYYFFSRTYNCYQVGYDSAGKLFYSHTIAGLICIFGSYLGISIIWNHFYTVRMFVVIFAVQTLWNMLWCVIATSYHLKKTHRKKAAVLYCKSEDISGIKEIYGSRFFSIEKEILIGENAETEQVLGDIKEFDALFISGVPATMRNGIAKYCAEQDIEGYFIPHVGDVIMSGAKHVQSFSVPLQLIQRVRPDICYLTVKRILDIILSFTGIVVLSPLMLIVAAAIKLNDGGRVIYRQERLTKDNRYFQILKFRSMKEDAEADGKARLATENDSRITRVGKLIRACRIDELPQMFNILKGDMSIVGPRPERPELAEQYSQQMSAYDLRTQVKAGLTGYAQVFGKYNSAIGDKLKLDLIYINRMNLLLDIQLVFATLKILFVKESSEGVKE